MISLSYYLRQCFCNHSLEFETIEVEQYNYSLGKYYTRNIESQTCKKCGFHKSYYKYK
jgi:hypothetical protein